jgi:hypothetical protein
MSKLVDWIKIKSYFMTYNIVGAKEQTEPRGRHELETSEKKNRRCTVRLFETNSLKEGAM